jgi:hypothetical protein
LGLTVSSVIFILSSSSPLAFILSPL